MSAKLTLIAAALSGALSVALGAFGAHGLKAYLSPSALMTWQTAVQYQMLHTVVLLLLGLLMLQCGPRGLKTVATGFMCGIVLFSGSLYWLALGGPKWLGPITPLGGLSFILAWLGLCFWAIFLSPESEK